MNIWKLIPHRDYPSEATAWIQREGIIAIGWGGIGDLAEHDFQNEAELTQIIKETYPGIKNSSNGGKSLWRLSHMMQKGDLVIISANKSRIVTMRVTGDYYYLWAGGGDTATSYEHRRRAEVTTIDPNQLWQAADKTALGEGKYSTLVRCTNSLSDADIHAMF